MKDDNDQINQNSSDDQNASVSEGETSDVENSQVPEPEIEPGVEAEETKDPARNASQSDAGGEIRTDAKSDGIETEGVIEESKDPEEKSEEVATSADAEADNETTPPVGDAEERSAGSRASEPEANEDAAPEIPARQDPQAEKTDEPAEDVKPANPNEKWYVVHTYSGHENKVASAVRQRVESEHLEHKIIDILVPTQDKIEIKGGKKESIKEKIFPGYILVKMVLDDTSWLAVRTTQGVTSFVGIGNKPTPIPEAEVRTIVKFMTQGATSTFKDVYSVNDTIKIVDGPFSDFIGKVDTVDKEKGKVRVLVSIFGRETPVELDFLQVQKL